MKTKIELTYGLPQKELVEKLYFHQRQSEVSERALGFYLLDMQRRNAFQPEKDAASWARKHLQGCNHPQKLIHLAKCLEELPQMAEAFSQAAVPWTKIREVARVASPEAEGVWLELARRSTSREIERAVVGVKRGDLPGQGLKARRVKYVERLTFSAAEKVIWGQAIRKIMGEIGKGATPVKAAIKIAHLALLTDPEGNVPGRKPHGWGLCTIVLHIGADGKRWIDTEEGRLEVDRETFEEIARSDVRTIEVKDIAGEGECPAIRFGERGKVAPEDRDRPVSPELKAAVLLRDGACVICQSREDLTPHHLDSHADGGKSDVTKLLTLCLSCQGRVHAGDLVLWIEEDGTVSARDREGVVVTKPRSAAEVLAEAGEECPLETLERRGTPEREAAPEVASETSELYSLDDLPSELSAAQWRALDGVIEWSPSQRTFLFHPEGLFRPEGESLFAEILAAAAKEPPREAVAPAAPGVRPGTFDDFVGQGRAVENLLFAARAAKARGEPLGHVILSGEPGLGKTTVARLLARECGSGLEEIVAGNIGDPHQLVSLLSRLPKGAFLLIDEIHALEKDCEECLYTAMDDGTVSVVLRQGARTRIVRVRLEPFTLVGATTRLGALCEPFRARFRIRERLEPYVDEDLAEVVVRAAGRMGTEASPEAAREVARRSKGTPREALRILERALDVTQLSEASSIESDHVVQAAERLGIDRHGLDPVERRAVKLLLRLGRPLGEEALAARVGVDRGTFHEVHEPWLERAGLIERTERGRVATEEARRLYGREAGADSGARSPGPSWILSSKLGP